MRIALAIEPMMINDAPHVITCSLGATSSPAGVEHLSDTLIRIADEALYAAKHEGRNCTVYQPPVQPLTDKVQELGVSVDLRRARFERLRLRPAAMLSFSAVRSTDRGAGS